MHWLVSQASLLDREVCAGRTEATGLGLFYGVREAMSNADDMKKIGLSTGLGGKRVVVQGLGNVGFFSAKFCIEGGATVIGIIEREGGVYNAKGLDIDALLNTARILNQYWISRELRIS